MLFSILKDSIVIFLLVYALLTLAEKFSKYLEKSLNKHPTKLLSYRIVDIRGVPSDRLEIPLKSALKASGEQILLLTGNLSAEAEHIVFSLIQSSENIHITSGEQLEKILQSPEGATAFFTRGDDHSYHSNRSISS